MITIVGGVVSLVGVGSGVEVSGLELPPPQPISNIIVYITDTNHFITMYGYYKF